MNINAIKTTIAKMVSHYENDEVLLWEMITIEVRNRSIKYSETRIKEIRKRRHYLKGKSRPRKVSRYHLDHNKTVVKEELMHKKKELETIIEYKRKGVII